MELLQFFQGLGVEMNDELIFELSKAFKKKQYEKGDYFHKQGNVCKTLTYIVEGVAVLQYIIEGKVIVRWAGLKNTFGTSVASFFNQEPSENEIQFLTDATVYNITKDDFDRMVSKFPAIQKLAIRILVEDLKKYQYLTDLLITAKGTERYLRFSEKYPRFIQEVPQKYIASILGMDPRHLSRIRKKLAVGPK